MACYGLVMRRLFSQRSAFTHLLTTTFFQGLAGVLESVISVYNVFRLLQHDLNKSRPRLYMETHKVIGRVVVLYLGEIKVSQIVHFVAPL